MNWTEGALVRHSRPGKGREVLLRQKEYFARVRAGVPNANVKTSPPSISFLAHPALSSPARHRSSTSKTSAPSSSKKRTLNHDPFKTSGSHYSPNDDDLKLPTAADFQEVQVKEEALRQKRRKLLLKGDWTGISLQKPIEMESSKPRTSRGGPWSYSKSRHAKSKSRMRHVLGIKCDAAQAARHPKVMFKTTGPTSPVQMRIRVGSRERVFGGSSNVSPQSRTFSHDPESTHNDTQLAQTHQDNTHNSGAKHQSPKWPELHQPFPQRPFLPSLFRSPTSDFDDAASTTAQVGVLQPEIPASLAAKNETWWRFVGGEARTHYASDLQPTDCETPVVQREISPGISQLDVPKTVGDADGEVGIVGTPKVPNDQIDGHLGASTQRQKDVLQFHELDSFFVGVSEDAELHPTDDEASSSSMGSGPVPFMDSLKTGENVAFEHQPGLPDADDVPDVDDVSMQVMSASCSPAAVKLLPQLRDDTNLGDHVDDVDARDVLPGPYLPEGDRELVKLPHLQKDVVTDQGLSKPSNTKKDDSDMWRDFILDDYDKKFQEAFEEARKETARNLQPSDPPTSTGDDGGSETSRLDQEPSKTNAALHIDPYFDVNNFTEQYGSSSTETSTVAPVSHIATFGHSSSDPLGGPDPAHSCSGASVGRSSPDLLCAPNPAGLFIRANVASSPDPLSAPASAYSSDRIVQTGAVESSRSPKNASLKLADEILSRSDPWPLVTGGQDNTSLVAHPSSLAEHSEAGETFRFARPKPFVGRKKAHLNEQRQIALSAPRIRGKGMTRRRQKRTKDGRASIRQVPSFSSDPIEEVEDALPVKEAQKPSLFGSLDTDEGLC
ncbi:hypothetical protein N0V82_009119 [Gnomoniopsis sp. IMI 355080]|nr:hypothetical protein N0V82_009119 [Gnomoniopsis sp. IMI 355080]